MIYVTAVNLRKFTIGNNRKDVSQFDDVIGQHLFAADTAFDSFRWLYSSAVLLLFAIG